MTGAFSIRNEANEQSAAVRAIWWRLAELVAPEPERPPGAQFTRHQADNIWAFSGPRDKLEVERPYLIEWQFT